MAIMMLTFRCHNCPAMLTLATQKGYEMLPKGAFAKGWKRRGNKWECPSCILNSDIVSSNGEKINEVREILSDLDSEYNANLDGSVFSNVAGAQKA